MSREQAMEALTQVAAARQPVKDAVYQYWLDKRKQLGKPLLRRLQAHTNSSDTNPHSCFRSGPVLLKPFHALLAFFLCQVRLNFAEAISCTLGFLLCHHRSTQLIYCTCCCWACKAILPLDSTWLCVSAHCVVNAGLEKRSIGQYYETGAEEMT